MELDIKSRYLEKYYVVTVCFSQKKVLRKLVGRMELGT